MDNYAGNAATPVLTRVLLVLLAVPLMAADWHVAPDGKAEAQGGKDSPWDIQSALEGKHKVAPGDTIWIVGGAYKHPNRSNGSMGYVVRLAGSEEMPINVRGVPGQRVTIDGGLTIQPPSTWLWIRDLEILVSENLTKSRVFDEPGSHPKVYDRPWGGLNVYSGKGCKYVNLVIHDNAQGISFWQGATDSEISGCIIYDNGWKAPDRGHGHAIYTQNKDGVKTIRDCIMTGGYSYTVHAYGSKNAYVDNYLIERNICYNAGTFLVGGGRPSQGIRVRENVLHGVSMQIGYNAPHNEDCEIRGNMIVNGGLTINRYKKAVNEENVILGRDAARPASPLWTKVQPDPYDANRATVAVVNWRKQPNVGLDLAEFCKNGDRLRIINPRDFYGKPVALAVYEGRPISVPVEGEFGAFVVLKGEAK